MIPAQVQGRRVRKHQHKRSRQLFRTSKDQKLAAVNTPLRPPQAHNHFPCPPQSDNPKHHHHNFSPPASLPPCYCGASVSEAVSLNCKFDSLSTSWLPIHCRDDELTALFERAGPGPNGEWTYYRTQPHLGDNLTAAAKYTVDELALLSEKSEAERQVVATVEWHDKHCFFLLLKMVRGKAPRMGYMGFPEVLGHAEHCAMSMVQAQGVPGYYPIIGVVPGFGDPL
ncbi:hypothetical protein V8F33_012884 [Rhypophila sp. PSN 637]